MHMIKRLVYMGRTISFNKEHYFNHTSVEVSIIQVDLNLLSRFCVHEASQKYAINR